MSIKNVCRLGALIIVKLSKEGCIFLTVGGRPFCIACKHDRNKCGPFNLKNIFLQNGFIENTKPKVEM
jgi:hypothetical protein